MLAPGPAARPAHALLELLLRPADAPFTGLLLLGVLDPADELVARQRRDVLPRSQSARRCRSAPYAGLPASCAPRRRARVGCSPSQGIRARTAGNPWDAVVVRTTTGPALVRVAATLWLVAGVAYLMAEALVARHLPGYSYSADYISDLGQPLHSPMAVWMNGAFIAQGMAFALAAALVVVAARAGPASVAFLGFAVMYGAGSAASACFPAAAPETPRWCTSAARRPRSSRATWQSSPPALCCCSADDSALGPAVLRWPSPVWSRVRCC